MLFGHKMCYKTITSSENQQGQKASHCNFLIELTYFNDESKAILHSTSVIHFDFHKDFFFDNVPVFCNTINANLLSNLWNNPSLQVCNV